MCEPIPTTGRCCYGASNDDDMFDVDLHLQDGDRLQLTFRCSKSWLSRVKVITYGYTWTAGRWTEGL
jgi:hypothetical protein